MISNSVAHVIEGTLAGETKNVSANSDKTRRAIANSPTRASDTKLLRQRKLGRRQALAVLCRYIIILHNLHLLPIRLFTVMNPRSWMRISALFASYLLNLFADDSARIPALN